MASRAERKASRRNRQPIRRAEIVGLPNACNDYAWLVRHERADYRTDPPSVRDGQMEVSYLRGPGAPKEGTPLGARGTVQWDEQALMLVWTPEEAEA